MANPKDIPVFKQEPILVLVLAFVTCGLYLIYWNMKMSEVMNAVAEKEIISPTIAAVCACCYPANVYFYYLMGQNLEPLGSMIGNAEVKDKATLLIILGLLICPVAAMILQGHVNEIYDKA